MRKKRFSQNPNFSHILCSVLQCLSQTAKAITPPNYHRALQLSRRKIKWQAIFIQIKQEMSYSDYLDRIYLGTENTFRTL